MLTLEFSTKQVCTNDDAGDYLQGRRGEEKNDGLGTLGFLDRPGINGQASSKALRLALCEQSAFALESFSYKNQLLLLNVPTYIHGRNRPFYILNSHLGLTLSLDCISLL